MSKDNIKGYDILTPAEQVEVVFYELVKKYDFNLSSFKIANKIDSLWDEIGDRLFAADANTVRINQQRSKLKFNDVKNIEEICKKYIVLCKRFGASPKIDEFANLTKIDRASLFRWHKINKEQGEKSYIFTITPEQDYEDYNNLIFVFNEKDIEVIQPNNMSKNKELSSVRYDCIKKIRESINNYNDNILDESPSGGVVRANNDPEVGKMWDARRQLTAAAIEQNKTALGAGELPKLSDNL